MLKISGVKEAGICTYIIEISKQQIIWTVEVIQVNA